MELACFYSLGFCVLAVTYIIRYTDGPFDIFLKFRSYIGINTIEENGEYIEEVSGSTLAKLVECPWCLATWIAFVFALLYCNMFGYDYFVFAWLYPIGFSGLIISNI